jgi:monoamine oxidase
VIASNLGNAAAPTQSWATFWNVDPWSWGSYSAVAPGADGTERTQLAAPVGKVLYWAGEATSTNWPATVQGAYQTGADAAAAAVKDHP